MPPSFVSDIKVSCVPKLKDLHHLRKGGFFHFEQKMDMVRHQCVGVKQKAKADFVFPQKAYISFIILRISKDLLPPISPGNHMIKSAGILNPWFPCHVVAIAEIEPGCQYLFS